ncbi:unnamed protein product, partial [Vitis vinifera]
MAPMDERSSSVTSSPLQLFSMMSPSPSLGSPYPWLRELKSEERGLCLIHLLLTCANHVASGSLENVNIALEQISQLASADGDTMQRIAAYFTEALADRILKTWSGLHKALNSTRISFPSEDILVRKLFFELFPFLKMAYVITNHTIIEAMEGEKMVHIIDLNSAEPAQWIALLQALSARPEGPPHLRITGIHPQKEVLEQMAHRLTEEAEKLDIPFQFNPIVSKLENLDFEKLRVKTGEALAISSVLQLHSFLAYDDEFLRKKSPLASKNSNGVQLQRVRQKWMAFLMHFLLDFIFLRLFSICFHLFIDSRDDDCMSCEHCTTTLLILGIFFSFFSSKLLCFIFVILGVCKIFDHLSKSFFKPCLVGFCLFLSGFYLFIYFLWKPIELKYDIELISVYDL